MRDMRTASLSFAIFVAAVCALPAADSADPGFRPLFNGKDLTGWHMRHPNAHNSWSVSADGVLKNTVEPGTHGVDLVTDQKFWNFTVRYEYMTPKSLSDFF